MIYILIAIFSFGAWRYLGKLSRFCDNPYKLDLVVGSKGSGKSLYMAQVADEWVSQHLPVYSNMGIGLPLREKYWLDEYPPDSLIMIDEVGVIHPDRDFKNFDPRCMEWYKMQRKKRVRVLLSSQTMDVDKKIRNLCDAIYVCHRRGWLCHLTKYRACISMVDTPTGGHDLVNDIRPIRFGGHWYTVPRTVRTTERLGYDTAQIISKNNSNES